MTREIEKARHARSRLRLVCDRLQKPGIEAWRASESELNVAIQCLAELELSLRRGSSSVLLAGRLSAEIAAVRGELAKAQALAIAAGQFYQGWARLMGLGEEEAANYTRHGAAPVASIHSGQVVMHG